MPKRGMKEFDAKEVKNLKDRNRVLEEGLQSFMADKILLEPQEYRSMYRDHVFLQKLEEAGVSSWSGYQAVLDMMEETPSMSELKKRREKIKKASK